MDERLTQLRTEAETELSGILNYWATYSIDSTNGGFFGKIDNDNKAYPDAPRGSVLNTRILWSFSAANNYSKNPVYPGIATRAYEYIVKYFLDYEFGGVYWTVTSTGDPLETKKQIYACAFAIYALGEYARASRHDVPKQHAIHLYNTLMQYGRDAKHGGFLEAFTRTWNELPDQRLSAKDANEKKTTNTNLHVLEAFCNLYLAWPDATLKSVIIELLELFASKVIDPGTKHLRLFFDEQWTSKPDVISYGHDVEASWLLQQCAEIIKDEKMVTLFRHQAVQLANAAIEGIDEDGGLWYEFDTRNNKMVEEKHWWPQAEAVVGFLNAWQITGDRRYLDLCLSTWSFIRKHLLNPSGEWYWGIFANGSPMQENKVGLWKCPYHNSRACLEILKRLTPADDH